MELPKGAAWGRDPRAREAGGESLESLGKRKRETCLRLRPGRMTTHDDAEGLEPAYGGLGTLLLPKQNLIFGDAQEVRFECFLRWR